MKSKKIGDELNEIELDNITGSFVSGTAFLIGSILYSVGCIAWAAYSARRRLHENKTSAPIRVWDRGSFLMSLDKVTTLKGVIA